MDRDPDALAILTHPVSRTLIASRARFQHDLLAWYRRHRRPLPWREGASPYRTVVSEFMLQQTQVKTVLPYFARWIEALPDFAALAEADEARVLKLWEGLGYYSRARNLHRLARIVVALPELPRTAEGWRRLPGVGPYTAAAVASIAFSAPAACVDGNVVRILARLTADSTRHHDSASAARSYAALAESLLSTRHPGDYNQAMMELGATVCVRRRPLCASCPVRAYCAGARTGRPEDLPRLAAKRMEATAVSRVWCERNGALLLHRAAPDARRLADLHELPTPTDAQLTNEQVADAPVIAVRRRGITRFAIVETIRWIERLPATRLPKNGLVWVRFGELPQIALSGPHRRWINEIVASGSTDAVRKTSKPAT